MQMPGQSVQFILMFWVEMSPPSANDPILVTMTCMTTKQKFDVEDPPVVVLKNGRFAYRVECPWKGKNEKTLTAFKFCSSEAYDRYLERHPEVEDMRMGIVEDEA